MSGQPRVSILIPTYNHGRFIAEAIDSVLHQRYPQLEVVVTDNASTDDTERIVRQRYAGEPRVRYFRNERNLGMVPNGNVALGRARGTFVGWLPSDDLLLPEHVARAVATFDRFPQLDVVYAGAYLADAAARVFGVKADASMLPADYVDARDELPEMLAGFNQVMLQGALFRHSGFDELGNLDESITFTDWELCIRWAAAGKRFAYHAEPSVIYRFHGANESALLETAHGRAPDTVRILEKYLDHPAMARVRGRELPIVRYLDEICPPGDDLGDPELAGRAARVREVLLARASAYEPARAREERVTVVVPMTFRPPALRAALDSVAAQTHPSWDVVVIDQGPVPAGPLLQTHPAWERISCIRLPVPVLPGAARNLGVRMARGEYLAFLDEDNVFAPDHLASLLDLLARTGAGVAAAESRLVVDRTDRYHINYVPVASADGVFRTAGDDPLVASVANGLPLNAVLHHRSFFHAAGEFHAGAPLLEDYDYLARLLHVVPAAFSGRVTLEVHVRLGLASQMLGREAERYLATLDALYAARTVDEEVAELRRRHRSRVADVLARRDALAAGDAGTVELISTLAGRAVFPLGAASAGVLKSTG
jgi:glycosyltransferase involved in cell wall biosynthesis